MKSTIVVVNCLRYVATMTTSPRKKPAARAAARKPEAGAAPADPGREAWALVVQIVKAARGRYLAEFDLTVAQAQLLLNLDVGRPAQMSEIANALGCDASNVTGLVDRLEARDLIERRLDPTDRRVKMVAVTDAGSRVQDKLHGRWYEPPAAIALLSSRDKKALLEIMRRAVAATGDAGAR